MINKKAKNKGFTLIETLVAIAIFAFAITGLISITATGIFNTNFVKNKFTASYLAVEGAELVRSIRDNAAINDRDWNATFADPTLLQRCYGANACFIDGTSLDAFVVPELCSNICPAISYRQGDDGKFNYDPVDGIDNFESIFTRIINIQPVGTGEVLVISRVEWYQGQDLKSTEFRFNMMDWIVGP